MTIALSVPGLPFLLSPSAETGWTVDGGTVTATAGPHSDI